MNRNEEHVILAAPAGGLPPREPDGRTRMLFLTLDVVGWSTYASTIAASTKVRDDIDAVHLRYQGRGIKRLFSAPVPAGRGVMDSNVRRVILARWLIRRWLNGPLDLSRFDVVHVTPQLYATGFIDAARRTATPLSTLLDATVRQEKGALVRHSDAEVWRRWRPLIEVEQEVFDAADLVVATSQWAADGARTDFGVSDEKLLVSPLRLPRRPSGELPVADPVHQPARIVFVGLDWRRKGGDRLLRWHQDHWSDRAELHLCTPVSPPQGLRNVFHHGLVPHEELVNRLLPSMDLFVLPTTRDMTPWAVMEAAAVGLPIVSSTVGAIGEMVLDGVTGFLLDPADERGFIQAVERLLADPASRQRMGAAARRHVDASSATTGHDQVLDRLIDLGRQARG